MCAYVLKYKDLSLDAKKTQYQSLTANIIPQIVANVTKLFLELFQIAKMGQNGTKWRQNGDKMATTWDNNNMETIWDNMGQNGTKWDKMGHNETKWDKVKLK